MKRTFYLVRHALKEKAIGDVPITQEGTLQAQLTASQFKNIQVDAIVTSPLRRAIETAEHIASQSQTRIIVDDRLRERANWGDLPDQTFEEFVEMWERSTRDAEYIPPVGDSAKLAGERLSIFLIELAEKYPTRNNIIIVTHGGLITDYLVNTFSEDQLNIFHPNFIEEQSNLIPECSITKLIYIKHNFIIDDFASTKHLKPKNV